MKIASGRIIASGVHSGVNTAKRGANTTSSSITTTTEMLGSSAKIGQVGREKERREKEDVELKPPWEMSPYSRDPSSGMTSFLLRYR